MPRMLRVTSRQLLSALERAGWRFRSQSGSHVKLTHAQRPGAVTIAPPAGHVIPPGTLKSILDQAGLTVDELIELLR